MILYKRTKETAILQEVKTMSQKEGNKKDKHDIATIATIALVTAIISLVSQIIDLVNKLMN